MTAILSRMEFQYRVDLHFLRCLVKLNIFAHLFWTLHIMASQVTSSPLMLEINFQAYFVGWVSARLVGFLGKVSVPAGAGTESFSCWESMSNHLLFVEEEWLRWRGCTDWMENKILNFLLYKNTQGKPSLPASEKSASGLRSCRKIWQSFFLLWNISISSRGLPVWWDGQLLMMTGIEDLP